MKTGQTQFGIRTVAVALVTVLILCFVQIELGFYKGNESDSSTGARLSRLEMPKSPVTEGGGLVGNQYFGKSTSHESSQSGSNLVDTSKNHAASIGSRPDQAGDSSVVRPRRLEISVTAGSVDVAAFRAQRIKVFVAAGEMDVVSFEDPWLIARRNDIAQDATERFDIARLVTDSNSTETEIALDAVQGRGISEPSVEKVLAYSQESVGNMSGNTGMAGIDEAGPAQQSGTDRGQLAAGEDDTFQEPLLDLAYVSDTQLEEHRGGFVLDNGIRIDFSIDRAAYVNDIEQFSSRLELPANLSNKTLSEVNAVQAGDSNLIRLADTTASIDLIQNSVDNQVIRDVTKYDIRIENFNIMQRLDYAVPGFGKVDTPTIFR